MDIVKKLVLILIMFVLASCSDGVVVEYTIVKEFEEDCSKKNDTITGKIISYKKNEPCLITYDGRVYSIQGNWEQGGFVSKSKPLPISNREKIIKFEQKQVEYCKIGIMGTKAYPKEIRKKYSKELVRQ